MNFQDIISGLDRYWAGRGCALLRPYDLEKGHGALNPAAFFGALSSGPFSAAYVETCRRPGDGRFGGDPGRLGRHYQYQVLIKPPSANMQRLCLDSLKAVGIRQDEHDIRWIEDDWSSPAFGAAGAGWEVWLDGAKAVRFTYFQKMASLDLDPVTAGITYGLERLALSLQKKKRVFDLMWNDSVSYGGLHEEQERQFSHYCFECADVSGLRARMEGYGREMEALLREGHYLPAYDLVMKFSHCFDIMEARASFPVPERTALLERIRSAAEACAAAYMRASGAQPPGGPRI